MTTAGIALLFVSAIAIPQIHVAQAGAGASENAIASKRSAELSIVLTTESGKLTAGENAFCLSFHNARGEAAAVRDVTAGFYLLVGRIQEDVIKVQFSPTEAGRYCGNVSFGGQYYSPSNYYIFARYIDAQGKRRTVRLFASVK
jgi:hypothetical protein